MDALANPYAPGAGTRPPLLTGRDPEIDRFRLLLGRLERGHHEQSLLITGLRGVGKTVLLDAFEGIAEESGWFASFSELTSDTHLPQLLATVCREALLDLSREERIKDRGRRALGVLKAFTISTDAGVDFRLDIDPYIGVADSGDLGRDIGELLIEVGTAAKEAERGVVFLLDEAQFIKPAEFEAMIAGIQRASRKSLPITIAGAGLPFLPKLAGEAKSYAERLFAFPRLGVLTVQAAREALVAPAEKLNVTYEKKAVKNLLKHSQRYPYFLQQYGKHAWLAGEGDIIDVNACAHAYNRVKPILDKEFFHVRIERANDSERRYMSAMAEQGKGPYKSGDVTRDLGFSSTAETGTIRDALIKKGLIYSPRYGQVAFTVPLFDDYVRRNYPLERAKSD
jgi:hypothetical protein